MKAGLCVCRVTCPTVSQRESSVLQEELLAVAQKHNHRFALNMQDVGMLSSVGIGMLVTLTRECKGKGGGMAVIGMTEPVAGVISITRLDKFLLIMDSVEAAAKRLL